MKVKQIGNNVPRNVIILAIATSIVLGIFRLIPLVILIWVISIAYILVYQYRESRETGSNFVCLDCATIHQQKRCPNCGSKLKKFYTKKNSRYGI